MTAGPGQARELARAAAGPVACAIALIVLLSGWVATGGAGTLTRIRLQVTLAAIPMRGYLPQTRTGPATSFLAISNLTATPDQLIGAASPVARRVVLTQGAGPTARRAVVSALPIPADGTLALSPFGDDVVLEDPVAFENRQAVPLTLRFRHSGTITIDVPVTAPGTP